MSEITITYEPDNSIKKGYLTIFKEIYREIAENKWLTYQLFRRDFFALYRQSLVGFLWAFVVPVVSVATFIVLNQSGVFSVGETRVPYPLYALLGIAFWQLFSMGLLASTNSLVNAGPMIVKINFSKISLVLSSMGQSVVSFVIQFLLACALFGYYRMAPDAHIVFLPLLAVPIVLLTIGLGFLLSLLNGVMRDIGNIISLLLTFFMFLTPILYTRPETGFLSEATAFNPIYYLVNTSRELILTGQLVDGEPYLISVALSVAVFLVCLAIFHLTETRVAERI